jgi:hypothetical protein
MLENVDAITTSTEKLAEAIRNFTDKPVFYVPDRMDLVAKKDWLALIPAPCIDI